MDSTFSKVALANLALYKIGAARITSFTDGSQPARTINDIYDYCREFVLEEYPWSFSLRTIALATLAVTVPDFGDGVSIAYALPDSFLSIYMISDPSAIIRIENISGQVVILSDTAGLLIKYVFNNDDPTTYSSKFYEALACKLAKEACFKLVQARLKVSDQKVDYQTALMSAIAADSKNVTPDQPVQDEWFLARMAGANTNIVSPNGNVGFGT